MRWTPARRSTRTRAIGSVRFIPGGWTTVVGRPHAGFVGTIGFIPSRRTTIAGQSRLGTVGLVPSWRPAIAWAIGVGPVRLIGTKIGPQARSRPRYRSRPRLRSGSWSGDRSVETGSGTCRGKRSWFVERRLCLRTRARDIWFLSRTSKASFLSRRLIRLKGERQHCLGRRK